MRIKSTTVATQSNYENHLSETEPRWFAVRTRFKSEKVALKQLLSYQINAYLPIKTLTRRYSKKIRHVEMPLINSFVFVKITKAQYIKVLETEYVAGFLKFGQNLLSIPEEQIDLIKRLLGENIEVTANEEHFQKGDMVEVIAGPLLGLRGYLLNIQGKERVMVELTNSGFTLQIDVDYHLLRRIDQTNNHTY